MELFKGLQGHGSIQGFSRVWKGLHGSALVYKVDVQGPYRSMQCNRGFQGYINNSLWTLTVPCFEEKIMSKEKHLSKYLFQMEAVVFIVLQIFFVTHTV